MKYEIRLQWLKDTEKVEYYLPPAEQATIGCDSNCDVVFQDKYMSSFHALLRHEDGKCYVENISSKDNPVAVEVFNEAGKRLHRLSSKEHALLETDSEVTEANEFILRIGKNQLRVNRVVLATQCPNCSRYFSSGRTNCPYDGMNLANGVVRYIKPEKIASLERSKG